MKTLKTIILAILLTTFSAAVSNAQNYKAPAIDFSGTIKDTTGHRLGTVTKEGIIKNHKGDKMAHINNKGQLVASLINGLCSPKSHNRMEQLLRK